MEPGVHHTKRANTVHTRPSALSHAVCVAGFMLLHIIGSAGGAARGGGATPASRLDMCRWLAPPCEVQPVAAAKAPSGEKWRGGAPRVRLRIRVRVAFGVGVGVGLGVGLGLGFAH